jgi:hypothetical protein
MTEAKKPTVFIATPMYGGQCAGWYTQSILNLVNVFSGAGINTQFSFMFNESLITRARNALAHQFLKTDATHLMFIDSDIRFNPADIVKMLEVDKEIICGIYPKKEINWFTVKQAMDNGVEKDKLQYYTGSFVVNLVNYAGEVTVPVSEPVEIFNGGTGFMLIKREVFETLADKVPSYTNDVGDLSNQMKEKEVIKEFFATSIEPDTNRLLSEDYHFCRIYRLAGGKVWAAPWAHLGHMGSYLFEGALIPAP